MRSCFIGLINFLIKIYILINGCRILSFFLLFSILLCLYPYANLRCLLLVAAHFRNNKANSTGIERRRSSYREL